MHDAVLQLLTAQQEPRGDGRRQQDRRADTRGEPQPLDERVLRRGDQRLSLLGRQTVGRLDRAAQRFMGRGGIGRRGALGRFERLVDAGDDGAEQGDAEGRAEFVRRLGDSAAWSPPAPSGRWRGSRRR